METLNVGAERRLKVLVCDDDAWVVRMLRVNLERRGHRVVTAFGGREALEKIESERPNLVVLDAVMPDIDGYAVLRSIRGNPETEHLPVVMISGKAKDEDIHEGYQQGADFYLTKPFNPMKLLSLCRTG